MSESILDIGLPDTMQYMAPEAIAGGVAAASDRGNLGTLLLERLTCGACFEGETNKLLNRRRDEWCLDSAGLRPVPQLLLQVCCSRPSEAIGSGTRSARLAVSRSMRPATRSAPHEPPDGAGTARSERPIGQCCLHWSAAEAMNDEVATCFWMGRRFLGAGSGFDPIRNRPRQNGRAPSATSRICAYHGRDFYPSMPRECAGIFSRQVEPLDHLQQGVIELITGPCSGLPSELDTEGRRRA